MKQVHGTAVVDPERATPETLADAVVTRRARRVCVVMTADCLPVFLSERAGRIAGIAHAGWRGLAGGILENTVRAMGAPPEDLIAYIGPGIGARRYEVGEEVRAAFVKNFPGAASSFSPARDGKYFADLYALARARLAAAGVTAVHGGGFCTASDERFFSYRRDRTTGRMANLIWLEDD